MPSKIIIGVLVTIIAIGTSIAIAQQHSTTANVDVTVWQGVEDGALYLSTRPEGGRWTTHNEALDMTNLSRSGNFRQGSAITVGVPVTVDIPLPDQPTSTETQTPAVDLPDRINWWSHFSGDNYQGYLLQAEDIGDILDGILLLLGYYHTPSNTSSDLFSR